MVLTTQEKSIDLKITPKPLWLALIYLPGNEINSVNNDFLISGVRPSKRIPFYRSFQYVDPSTKETLSITIHPGTNIGYHVRNNIDNSEKIVKLPVSVYEIIASNPVNQHFFNGSIVTIYPDKNLEDLEGMPRYLDFSDEDAIRLVNSHTHEKWIDLALIGENRSAIKTTAEARKLQIIEHRRKLQEGLV